MAESVTISEAAKALGVTASTVRRWIQHGAPTECPGKEGRGHGALVNLQALSLWRASRLGVSVPQPAVVMEKVKTALLDVLKRDGGQGVPAPVELGIPGEKAAALLAHGYNRIQRLLCGSEQTARECAVLVSSSHEH